MLTRRSPSEAAALAAARRIDDDTMTAAAAIVRQVRAEGAPALRRYAETHDGLAPDAALVVGRPALEAAAARLRPEVRALFERTRDRIARFAEAQRNALGALRLAVPGGCAGHDVVPLAAAGCYAPGGRYPLPSSVLMTVVTARVAGVARVVVASPRPADVTLAAAAVAGADALVPAGGAQAVAALAYGFEGLPRVDAIVGPGNRWVTAAKQIVSADVRIDMLAGPSELAVLADDSADPATIAADLLAQAEHDPDARVTLVSLSARLVEACERALAEQLAGLPTAAVARASLAEGAAIVCRDLDEAVAVCDALAPEHLQLHTARDADIAARLGHYGALFYGRGAAEVIGDYGAGPNHVLPTAGTARQRGGLSVLDFLRVRTWLHIDDPEAARPLYQDAAALAELEGLRAHSLAASRRVT